MSSIALGVAIGKVPSRFSFESLYLERSGWFVIFGERHEMRCPCNLDDGLHSSVLRRQIGLMDASPYNFSN